MPSDRKTPARRRRRRRGGYTIGAHIYQRGGRWYAFWGGNNREALGVTDESEARRKFGERLAAGSVAGRRGVHAGKEALDVIAEEYFRSRSEMSVRSRRSVRNRIVAFVESMAARGIVRAPQVTTSAVDAWRSHRLAACKASTVNRDMDVVRRAFKWARTATPQLVRPHVAASIIEALAPITEAKDPRVRVVPAPADVAGLLVAIRSIDRRRARGHLEGLALAVEASDGSGLRMDELRHIQPEHVTASGIEVRGEDGPAATSWHPKHHHIRFVPLATDDVEAVRRFVVWRNAHGWRMADGAIGKTLTRALRAAGLPDTWRMHDLRRAFATRCYRAGVPLTVLRTWMGHRDVATTERYLGGYRTDATITAPSGVAARRLSELVSEPGASSGLLQPTPAHSTLIDSSREMQAPPIRIERTTNGLGNRCSIH